METDRQVLFSERISANGRMYFFDVKVSARGHAYLMINESKRNSEGKYDHHRVMVFEDILREFRDTFAKAVEFVENRPK